VWEEVPDSLAEALVEVVLTVVVPAVLTVVAVADSLLEAVVAAVAVRRRAAHAAVQSRLVSAMRLVELPAVGPQSVAAQPRELRNCSTLELTKGRTGRSIVMWVRGWVTPR